MKNLTLLFLLISSLGYSQEKKKEKLDFQPDIVLAIITNHYFGNNYLAQGHQNPSIGFQIKSDWLHYNKYSLGFGIEKSTQKVTEFSVGGNIDKTNTNSINLFLSYQFKMTSKFSIRPEFASGSIELRQKSGEKLYGSQSGERYGLGANLNYSLNKAIALYLNISYNRYDLNVKTSKEFINYFNNSNAITLSSGIKFQ